MSDSALEDYRRLPRAGALDADSLHLSEIFSSLQGEGRSLGAPALFVRLALCNLRCGFCDTKYTWDFRQYRYEDQVYAMAVEQLARRIDAARERRVIVTGGEPLLQQAALARVFARVLPEVCFEVETNGTIEPAPELLAAVTQWNVSPKLAHSLEPMHRRIHLDVLSRLRDTERSDLKLVVRARDDLAEIDELIAATRWPAERVFLMPEATTPAEHGERAASVAALCQERGYRFSPRLHVLLWGGARGR